MRRPEYRSSAPLSLDEEHEKLVADVESPEDAISVVESYYVYQNPSGYSPEKIGALVGKSRSGRKLWGDSHIDHVIRHIEALEGEVAREKVRREKEFDKILAQEYGVFGSAISLPTAIPANLELVSVRNQYGARSLRYRDVDTGRWVKFQLPEQVGHFELQPRDLEKKGGAE